jgi:V/A-type H+-transporting ATPase subunit E
MTTAAIVADIERETASEVARILADAEARAAALVDAARTDLRSAVDAARARAEPAARLDAARRINAARLRLLDRRADLATARSEAVFDAAGRRIEAIAGGADPDRWAAALVRLVGESLDQAGPGATVVVRPADLALVAGWASTADVRVTADDDAAAGVRMVSADGRIEIDATLSARLDRARVRLAEAVATRLGLGG